MTCSWQRLHKLFSIGELARKITGPVRLSKLHVNADVQEESL